MAYMKDSQGLQQKVVHILAVSLKRTAKQDKSEDIRGSNYVRKNPGFHKHIHTLDQAEVSLRLGFVFRWRLF